jgi:hypothetical protein
MPPLSRRPTIALLAGLYVVAVALAVIVLRPISSASIGPDAAAPVVHFQRILAGQHLEGYLGQTPKPLLTVLYGVLYAVFHDWRPIAWAVIAAFALCVVLGGVLGRRVGGLAGGAFVAIGILFSAVLLMDLELAYSVTWALLFWLVAGLAVSGRRPRYELAGIALMLATLARLETLIVVVAAAAFLLMAEVVARRTHRPRPPRGAYLILLGFLALPVMLVHDWLLTGDPLFWAKIAQLNSVGAANIRGPVRIALSLGLHFVHTAAILPLVALGAFVLLRRRQWPIVVGLLALGPGVAAFLVYLGARGIFVSNRYLAPIDLSALFTAGMGLGALDAPQVRRLIRRTLSAGRRTVLVPLLVGVFAALALAPIGLLDATTRGTISTQIQLHANEQRAMTAIRAELRAPSACFAAARAAAPAGHPTVVVPSRLRVQAVVDLDLRLTQVTKPGGIALVGGLPAAGQIVYHDRLDGQTTQAYALYEISQPVVKGDIRLVPILADPAHGFWVVRVEAAGCS